MSKASTISEEILRRIRTNVYTGKVPGERALAAEFDVNFKTANRAVGLLIEQGILHRKRGEGTFISPVDQRRDQTIGLCFFKHTDPGRDPVFTRFFSGMNGAVKASGLRLDVTALQDVIGSDELTLDDQRERFGREVLATDPDGLIVLGNIDDQLVEMLRADRPTVVVGQVDPSSTFDTVRRDVAGATADAVRRFADSGHRHIALATYDHEAQAYDLAAKQQGYLSAIGALGLERRILSFQYHSSDQLAQQIVESMPRPTAVIATESSLGLALIRHAPSLDLAIPEDLALISFDDGDVGSFTRPTMSSIHAFSEELAQLAVQRLIEKLDGKIDGRIDDCLPCPYIERQSGRDPSRISS